MIRVEDRVRYAQKDVDGSPELKVVGSYDFFRQETKKGRMNRRLVIAVGELDRANEAWNPHVERTYDPMGFERHTAFQRDEGVITVLEVLVFKNQVRAEEVVSRMEDSLRHKLEIVER